MGHWLLKTEPGEYGWDDLVREKRTVWTGVKNPLALKHLGEMKVGDLALIYHTGDERAAVGIARVVAGPRRDPKGGEKSVVVDIEAVRALAHPVSLAAIKADKVFAGWELVRIGRLSVMPVPGTMWKRIEAMAKGAK